MERLKRMSVFAKVVEFGSFTAAARQLQMSVSSISQTVSKLEDELQVKLLNRSTRSIGLTEAGRIYYQGCRRMLHEVQDVHEQLYAFNNTPIGTLRIGCSSTMAQNVLAGLTAKMLKEYPGLSVNLVTGIPAPDLIADGLDVVIRVGALQDSSLFSRRLGAMPMVVCAAKSYLTQYGIPEKPADLSSHSWLEYSVRPDNEFELIAPEGISTRLIPQGRFVTNDPMTLVRWLTAGAGIAYVPLMWVINEINRGELEILLPRYQSDPRPVYALYTEKDKLPLKVQVVINSQEIIESVEYGIYAPNFGGGQVDITSGKFVFSTSEAYLIENGKVTKPVKGATLIGSGIETMQQISMVGNDLKLDNGVGVCGKEGQSLPVGVGQPTLKVDNLTVGGTA